MNSYRPNAIVIDVLGMSSSAMRMWWYALTRSILEKTCAFDRLLAKSCRCGMGYLSGTVRAFRVL